MRAVSLVGWAVFFAIGFAWEGFTLARRPDGMLPMSDIIGALRLPVARWIAFALWLWFGWHVFVRTWDILPGR